jgi:hypothetical protein
VNNCARFFKKLDWLIINMGERTKTGEVPALKGAGRTPLRQRQLRGGLPVPNRSTPANVIDISEARRRKGNEFKPETGRERVMVEEIPEEQMQDIMSRLQNAADERERKKSGIWSRDEVVAELKKFGPGLDGKVLQLMRIPPDLYHSPIDNVEFSSKEGEVNSGMAHNLSFIMNSQVPATIENYALGTFAHGSHGYFFLIDPSRKLIFINDLPDLQEHGNWNQLVRPLDNATKAYEKALKEGTKFSKVVSIFGSTEVHS